MAKTELARVEFVADKTLPKLKRCLDKKSGVVYQQHPAIELASGIMIASEGHILVAHKLQDYKHQQLPYAKVDDVVMLPASVLDMKGKITATVTLENSIMSVTIEDEQGTSETMPLPANKYPDWRWAVPSNTGYGVAVDVKSWEQAIKAVTAKDENHFEVTPLVRLYGDENASVMSITSLDCNALKDSERSKDVDVTKMPYHLWVWFNTKKLQAALKFMPTEMLMVDNTKGCLFTASDTLLLLMPIRYDDDTVCTAKGNFPFSVDKFFGSAKPTATVKPTASVKHETPKPQPKAEPSLLDILSDALESLLVKQAA